MTLHLLRKERCTDECLRFEASELRTPMTDLSRFLVLSPFTINGLSLILGSAFADSRVWVYPLMPACKAYSRLTNAGPYISCPDSSTIFGTIAGFTSYNHPIRTHKQIELYSF